MKSVRDEIALQGIEFWSNVCDEEYELQLRQQEVGNPFPFNTVYIRGDVLARHKNKIDNQKEQVGTMHVALYNILFQFYFND